MKQYQYIEVLSEELQRGDVVVWKDENEVIQHAAYHIGEGYFFNKHGQTMFNPWKILSKEQLYEEWSHLALVKFSNS